MQWRAALWIIGAFRTSPSKGIEAIAGLIPITLYLCKLNSRHYLQYASIPPLHAINSLLDSQHAKNQPPHRVTTSKLTAKQQVKLKSPIKDANKCLNDVRNCFNPLHPLVSPGSCQRAKLRAGIKPTALCSALDKENSIEFSLDFLHYLYNYYMVCALFSHTYHVTHHVTWYCDCVTLVTWHFPALPSV